MFVPSTDMEPPGRLLRNILADTVIKCAFQSCCEVMDYNNYQIHKNECSFNPESFVSCAFCDQTVRRCKIDDHNQNCVHYLSQKITEMETELAKLKNLKNEVENEKRVAALREKWSKKTVRQAAKKWKSSV